ncbi:IS3 family transposase [Abyssisolibacter fermentans]|uniref:IS3 family transposase n=1 Tax=Abyssisolibacter fermentans TaxID=1766203 RepID=UPI003B83A1F1
MQQLHHYPSPQAFSHYKCETIHLMKDKIKDLNDVIQITEEYMEYYINYRPQKNLEGVTPYIYKQKCII